MKIITQNGCCCRVPKGAVVMLGYFDGFHKGHMALCDAAYRMKKQKNAACVLLWTFERLSKGKAITDNGEKAEAFFSYLSHASGSELSLDDGAAVIFEDFSKVSHLTGEEFVRTVLKDQLEACAVVCGFNFRFGRGGACGADELPQYCRQYGMECCVVPPVEEEGAAVSSTELRRLIEAGEVEAAAKRMGRPYSVTSPVIHGKRLGHSLGFPTVNQRIPADKVMPAFGVYACSVKLPEEDGGTLVKNGVCNVGNRPTVNGDADDVTMETYIFDYEGDLYGKVITVSLCKRLRGEVRFSSKEELSRRIARDKAEAMDYFERG